MHGCIHTCRYQSLHGTGRRPSSKAETRADPACWHSHTSQDLLGSAFRSAAVKNCCSQKPVIT